MSPEIRREATALLNVVRFPNGPIRACDLGDRFFSSEAVGGALETIYRHYSKLGIRVKGTEMLCPEEQAVALALSALGLGSIPYNFQ